MSDNLTHVNFRLGDGDEDVQAFLSSLTKRGERSDVIKRAIRQYMNDVSVSFDRGDPIDREIIEAIGHMEDQPRRIADWLKARAYERLTGTDATTRQPLPEQTKIVEVEKPVIVYRDRIIQQQGAPTSAQADDTPAADDTTTNAAHSEIDNVGW